MAQLHFIFDVIVSLNKIQNSHTAKMFFISFVHFKIYKNILGNETNNRMYLMWTCRFVLNYILKCYILKGYFFCLCLCIFLCLSTVIYSQFKNICSNILRQDFFIIID